MPSTDADDVVVVNLSGRGDKDMETYGAMGEAGRPG
jgi:tryptophan synthase beta subunit